MRGLGHDHGDPCPSYLCDCGHRMLSKCNHDPGCEGPPERVSSGCLTPGAVRCYCETDYCDHAPHACSGTADLRYAIDYIGQACTSCIRAMRENGGEQYVHELPTADESAWLDS